MVTPHTHLSLAKLVNFGAADLGCDPAGESLQVPNRMKDSHKYRNTKGLGLAGFRFVLFFVL